jgi:hypothetical protein
VDSQQQPVGGYVATFGGDLARFGGYVARFGDQVATSGGYVATFRGDVASHHSKFSAYFMDRCYQYIHITFPFSRENFAIMCSASVNMSVNGRLLETISNYLKRFQTTWNDFKRLETV